MNNFPVPYPEELVYSIVARAGVHCGITSAKELLDEVFKDRKVIATFDLPSHLAAVSKHYPSILNLTPEALAYNHTLFSLYAPFVIERRRKKCLKWMYSKSCGAVHLALGVSASTIKQQEYLRFCPHCIDNQLMKNGELYWDRRWQITGADCCLEHGNLTISSVKGHNYHRHAFEDLSPKNILRSEFETIEEQSYRMTKRVYELLDLSPRQSCTLNQWSLYYRQLATENNCLRGTGKQICFNSIKEKIESYWTSSWLSRHDLVITNKQTCWLRNIFRKHRKTFSYLQHLTVMDAFNNCEISISEIIEKVSTIKRPYRRPPTNSNIKLSIVNDITTQTIIKRECWLSLIKKFGPKQSRNHGGAAVYAWLYRNDSAWLLNINCMYKVENVTVNNRVDWKKRDHETVRSLIQVKNKSIQDINSCRRSKNWYLEKLSNTATVSKNIEKLPLTNNFLDKYDEDIESYQLRRVQRAIKQLKEEHIPIRRWRIMRISGLSEVRIKAKAKDYLNHLEV